MPHHGASAYGLYQPYARQERSCSVVLRRPRDSDVNCPWPVYEGLLRAVLYIGIAIATTWLNFLCRRREALDRRKRDAVPSVVLPGMEEQRRVRQALLSEMKNIPPSLVHTFPRFKGTLDQSTIAYIEEENDIQTIESEEAGAAVGVHHGADKRTQEWKAEKSEHLQEGEKSSSELSAKMSEAIENKQDEKQEIIQETQDMDEAQGSVHAGGAGNPLEIMPALPLSNRNENYGEVCATATAKGVEQLERRSKKEIKRIRDEVACVSAQLEGFDAAGLRRRIEELRKQSEKHWEEVAKKLVEVREAVARENALEKVAVEEKVTLERKLALREKVDVDEAREDEAELAETRLYIDEAPKLLDEIAELEEDIQEKKEMRNVLEKEKQQIEETLKKKQGVSRITPKRR